MVIAVVCCVIVDEAIEFLDTHNCDGTSVSSNSDEIDDRCCHRCAFVNDLVYCSHIVVRMEYRRENVDRNGDEL